jgi:hypothetical protein
MARLRETTLRKLIENGETSTVELKVAVPRPGEMAERLCGLANAQSGDGPLKRDEVGREGIEPSWVAPGDFKSPASTVSPPPHTGSVALCA